MNAHVTVLDFAGKNLALNKPAKQVSTFSSDTADKAVDGHVGTHSCTLSHTAAHPWWTVDLGAAYDIGHVTVTNDANLRNYHRRTCTVYMELSDMIQRNVHRVRKKTWWPPKHVKITLWIENDSQYFSVYHKKPSICNVCVKFHYNKPIHCWDIAFYKKVVEIWRLQHLLITHMRIDWRDVNDVMERLIEEWYDLDHNIICAVVNQWRSRLGACVRTDGGHFKNQLQQQQWHLSIELIPTVFIVLETCVFSVSSKR